MQGHCTGLFETPRAIEIVAALTKPMALLTVMPGDADFVKYDRGGGELSSQPGSYELINTILIPLKRN
jgi:hypothetical protein